MQTNTHALIQDLRRHDHNAAALAGLTKEGMVGLRSRIALKIKRGNTACDSRMHYPVYRAWHPAEVVQEVVKRFKPDIVIVQTGATVSLAKAFVAEMVPTIIYLHDVQYEEHAGDIGNLTNVSFIANSQFVASRYHKDFGIHASVLNPLFHEQDYKTSTGLSVTFINPIPLKGVDLVCDICALCPDIPFQFVRAWSNSGQDEEKLHRRLKSLRNVTLCSSTLDMKTIYRDTRILLVPSRCEEAWGRVASEAQFSGIPVLATSCGGLPEAVGPGGKLFLPEAKAEDWAAVLKEIWNDQDYYEFLRAAAFAHSKRPELDPVALVTSFIDILQQRISR